MIISLANSKTYLERPFKVKCRFKHLIPNSFALSTLAPPWLTLKIEDDKAHLRV